MSLLEAAGRVARRPGRQIQAFGVGSAKSGTHSIAALFGRSFRGHHEPACKPMIRAILARSEGTMSDAQVMRMLLRRDRRLRLEMDSSQLNAPFLDLLPTLFPESKFIFTIRDCASYLTSVIDHQLTRGKSSQTWRAMRQWRFGGFAYSRHEHILRRLDLYPIAGYLAYWARHNRSVLEHVPADRLLVVRTDQITASIPRMAEFLGIPADSLDAGHSHAYRATRRYGIVEQLDPQFVSDCMHQHCEPIMRQFFPEIRHYMFRAE
ncbi:MAG TPA: sulfotransferase [Tepidisphaeraceae bacterium]|jgi:hypothetical protein|nr:sulfotransferase [Tepidisphaeraceae bacterium]